MMTQEQQAKVFDLNGRGWSLLVIDHRSSRRSECNDIFLLDPKCDLYRVNGDGCVDRMVPSDEKFELR